MACTSKEGKEASVSSPHGEQASLRLINQQLVSRLARRVSLALWIQTHAVCATLASPLPTTRCACMCRVRGQAECTANPRTLEQHTVRALCWRQPSVVGAAYTNSATLALTSLLVQTLCHPSGDGANCWPSKHPTTPHTRHTTHAQVHTTHTHPVLQPHMVDGCICSLQALRCVLAFSAHAQALHHSQIGHSGPLVLA